MAIETLSTIISNLQVITTSFKEFFLGYGLSEAQAFVATICIYLGISMVAMKVLGQIIKWVFILLLVWLILSIAGVSIPLPFNVPI